ncbi:MAG: biotin synthase BioB, partial [Candidatus Dormiibacterota bacterium]
MQETLDRLVDAGLDRREPNREDALKLLRSPDDEVQRVVAAAYEVRRAYFGKRVKLNFLLNMKSGLCPEDCHYCSQ